CARRKGNTMLNTTEIEDIYPLSPMQRGMLFHTLYAPQSGVYFQQVGGTLRGAFDAPTFRRAWEHMLGRHAVLRSAVIWQGLDEPMQVVLRKVQLPIIRWLLNSLVYCQSNN